MLIILLLIAAILIPIFLIRRSRKAKAARHAQPLPNRGFTPNDYEDNVCNPIIPKVWPSVEDDEDDAYVPSVKSLGLRDDDCNRSGAVNASNDDKPRSAAPPQFDVGPSSRSSSGGSSFSSDSGSSSSDSGGSCD